MGSRYYVTIILALTFIGVCSTTFVADAQDASPTLCSALIKNALNQVGSACANLALNTTCYGYPTVERTTLVNGVAAVDNSYSQPGSVADLKSTNSLKTDPIDVTKNLWGVNLMNVQGNLPIDATDPAAKGIDYIQFGGLQVVNGSGAGENPMQNVVLSTVDGGTPCADAPPFVLIQAPENTSPQVIVNGVTIGIHSTISVSIDATCVLHIGVIMGSITINVGTNQVIIPRGQSITVPLDADCKFAIGNFTLVGFDPFLTTLKDVIDNLPSNLLNYVPVVPIISCPSGVGQPGCILINPL